MDQIGTANDMISDKFRIDGKVFRLLSYSMSAVVICGSLRIADRLIIRCSLVQVQVAALFYFLLRNMCKTKSSSYINLDEEREKAIWTAGEPLTGKAVQLSTTISSLQTTANPSNNQEENGSAVKSQV